MTYQTKYHAHICSFFRYLSFASVVLMLLVGMSALWFGWPEKLLVTKFFVMTCSIVLASGVIGIIFTDKQPKNKSDLS